MMDGSVFTMPNETWQRAFNIKYGENKEEAIKAFKELTKKHFDAKTVPTKFGFDVPWEEGGEFGEAVHFKNHAELGEVVMYIYLRPAILAVAMAKVAKGEKKVPKVIGISKDGTLTEYSGEGKRKITSLK